MSVSLVIIPLAIAVVSVAKQAKEAVRDRVEVSQKTGVPCVIETKYADQDILCKTLQEHGLDVRIVDNNTIRSQCRSSSLIFSRTTETQPFSLTISSPEEVSALGSELSELDEEYGMNVQSYTYDHVKNNLEEGMTIASEEVLDDNSILLTIEIV